VLFDQRGAGRSKPKGSRSNNTLPDLVADMEAIRARFGFQRWIVSGGSWGATLGLAYAQAHPDHVAGLVLRATFLGTRAEVENAFGPTLARFYPDLHRDFLDMLPPEERDEPVKAYWRRILDPDPAIHGPAARAWHDTERALSEVKAGRTQLDRLAIRSGNAMPATPFMEAHYFDNDSFMAPGQLLRDASKLAGIPGIIVQGRYDLLCPPATSAALASAWREAEIRVVEAAGHNLYDPGIRDAVMKAHADMAARTSSLQYGNQTA
jgi:proline iminopeptidase